MAKWRRPEIPLRLVHMEQFAKANFELEALEGKVVDDFGLGASGGRWRYEKEKGGWQYLGGPEDSRRSTNTDAEVSDIYGKNPRGLKKVPVPKHLIKRENKEKLNFNLGNLEGEWYWDEETMLEWTYERAKGGWFVSQNLAESLPVTNTHGLISDSEASESESDSVTELPKTLELASLHRLEEGQARIEDQLGDSFNYTMLSMDNAVLKIGESREKGSSLKEYLVDRYSSKKNGGPFRYIAHQTGTRRSETAALKYLEKCGIEPIYGREYFRSHQAIEYLRTYGHWPLGEFSEIGGFLPPIKEKPPEPEQGSLLDPPD